MKGDRQRALSVSSNLQEDFDSLALLLWAGLDFFFLSPTRAGEAYPQPEANEAIPNGDPGLVRVDTCLH